MTKYCKKSKGFAMRLMHLGYTVYVVDAARKAKEKHASVIAVTSKRESLLAGFADQILVIPGTVKGDTGEGRGPIQLLGSLFDQSLHIGLDAVCLFLSYRYYEFSIL